MMASGGISYVEERLVVRLGHDFYSLLGRAMPAFLALQMSSRLSFRGGRHFSRLALLVAGLVAAPWVTAVAPTPDELAASRQWAAARFQGQQPTPLPAPGSSGSQGASLATAGPFSFTYDGRSSDELLSQWPLQCSSRDRDPDRAEHVLTWNDPHTGLQVRCVAVEYRDFPTVEWTLYFKNLGTSDTPLLADIQALDARFGPGGAGEVVLHHHTGDNCSPTSYEPHELTLEPGVEHRFAPAGGRPTSFAFPYFNLAWAGEGVIVVVGWPGQWAAQFTREPGQGVRVRAGQELTHLKLHPGEEIRTPLMVLQFWKGDLVRAQNLWRRWMLAHNLPRTREDKLPAPLFASCSGGFFPGLKCNEAGERQFITGFLGAGVKLDYWWMDAGWYPCGEAWPNTGNWTPDPERFPHGLKAISDLAHTNGMGLIVWFEPERVTPGTWLYTNNPAWLLGPDGQQKLLNLGNAEARHWLTDHVDRLLTEQGIDLYRQDFNIDPLAYWRANDSADRQGMTENRDVAGYLAYWDELRRRHPGMLIDSCASGGRRNDLETLRRALPLLRSDYQAFDGNPAYAPGNQCHTYGLSSWIPYYGQGVYFSERQFVYAARSYMSPAYGVACDVRKAGADWALIRRVVEQWRQVAPCYLGDFYPLTPYRLEDDVWLAWQFDLPERSEGMIQAFRRASSPYEVCRLKLCGLDPAGRYRVTDLDTATPREIIGRELMETGVQVSLPERASAALFTYQRLK